jgi:drug/metabolite transporter (DMT)-like permease
VEPTLSQPYHPLTTALTLAQTDARISIYLMIRKRNQAAGIPLSISDTLLSPQVLLTFSALFWSGNFIVGRALRGAIPPVSLSFWCWAIALAILLPLSFVELRQHQTLLLREWKLILALGATGVAAFHSFVYTALTTTPAVNALLFLSLVPMAIAAVSWLVFRDTITLRQIAGILLSVVGALVVIAQGNIATLLALHFNPGDIWMLGAVAIWAIYSVLLKRRPAQLPQLALLTATVIAGVALLFPVYLWQHWRGETMVMTGSNLLGLLYIAVFASVVAFLFWNRSVAEIGPTKAGMYANLLPVFGAVLAVLFLGEPIALYQLLGAVLVFSGIFLTSQGSMTRHGHAPPCT